MSKEFNTNQMCMCRMINSRAVNVAGCKTDLSATDFE